MHTRFPDGRVVRGLALFTSALLLCACGSSSAPESTPVDDAPGSVADFHTLATPALASGQIELLTLSTLPDTVTNGDVLVGVRGVGEADTLQFSVNGAPVDVDMIDAAAERRALISDLRTGENRISVTATGPDGNRSATLTVRNHPVTGPVISGPHQHPFRCRTEDAELGAPLDEDCSVATRYQWFYRSAIDQSVQPLDDPYSDYPADTLMTELADGRIVPYVVRVESATINRGIARIAVLDDPAARGPDAPFDGAQFNRKVYYAYGESCGVGFDQGVNDPEIVLGGFPDLTTISADRLLINLVGIQDRLGKGDAIVHSTLSSFGVHCNPMISIETTMMIKEHISETYGLVETMVGTNGSGAALQQYNAANNAPGLLSGAMPTATFADIPSTAMTVTDCGLLQHYYEVSELDWSVLKQAAVNGHNLLTGSQLNAICQSWTDAFFDRVVPTRGCSVPEDQRYHPENNPTGARCTIQDANVNIFGIDPQTGFAYRPLDNVGVQYGLEAFNAGVISFDEFLDLNRNIGGLDIDGNFVPARHAMDPDVAELTYRIGGVIGRGALAETPVMDIAPYLDLIPTANIHEAVRPFTVRARLREHTGQDVTQSIWRGVLTQPDAFPQMYEWLDNLDSADSTGDRVQDVMLAKPATAADRCAFGTLGGRLELPDAIIGPLGIQLPLLTGIISPLSDLVPVDIDIPLRVDVPEDFDSGIGPCSLVLPVTSTPRMVAGMPMSDDVLKCQLKPLDPADYAGGLSAEQLGELASVFPDGVCDYSLPGVGEVEHSMQWVSLGGDTLTNPRELRWRTARSPSR